MSWPVLLLLWVAITGILVGATWLVRTAGERADDPDARFWYPFAAGCLIVPALLGTALVAPAAAGVLTVGAGGTGLLLVWRWPLHRGTLRERHLRLLTEWARYDLDPGAALAFPALHDVRVPATQVLVRAAARAEACRDGVGYRAALTELEQALRGAEAAAGCRPSTGPGGGQGGGQVSGPAAQLPR